MADDITWTNVFDTAPIYGGCGPQSVTCYGNAGMLSIIEEVYLDEATGNPQRIIRSLDDGATWTEEDPYFSFYNLWVYQAMSPAVNVILVGTKGPDEGADQGVDAGVVMSTDAGHTWASAMPADFADVGLNDYWDMVTTIQCDGDRLLSAGQFKHNGTEYHVAISDGTPILFDDYRTVLPANGFEAVTSAAYCGDGFIVLGTTSPVAGASGHRILLSMDNGDTWTEQRLQSTVYPDATPKGVDAVCATEDGLVVAIAHDFSGANYIAHVWVSTDRGITWTERTAEFLAGTGWLVNNQAKSVKWVYSWDSQHIAIGLDGRPDYLPGGSPVALSSDGGASWTVTSWPGFPDIATRAWHWAGGLTGYGANVYGIADDGSIVVGGWQSTLDAWGIWRGVPTWEATPGPCYEATPPIPEVPHTFPGVPTYHPFVSCDQECAP